MIFPNAKHIEVTMQQRRLVSDDEAARVMEGTDYLIEATTSDYAFLVKSILDLGVDPNVSVPVNTVNMYSYVT